MYINPSNVIINTNNYCSDNKYLFSLNKSMGESNRMCNIYTLRAQTSAFYGALHVIVKS